MLSAPKMAEGEYPTQEVLLALSEETAGDFAASLAVAGTGMQDVLIGLNPAWAPVGRVDFDLAEHHCDPDHPFAFMATVKRHPELTP